MLTEKRRNVQNQITTKTEENNCIEIENKNQKTIICQGQHKIEEISCDIKREKTVVNALYKEVRFLIVYHIPLFACSISKFMQKKAEMQKKVCKKSFYATFSPFFSEVQRLSRGSEFNTKGHNNFDEMV